MDHADIPSLVPIPSRLKLSLHNEKIFLPLLKEQSSLLAVCGEEKLSAAVFGGEDDL